MRLALLPLLALLTLGAYQSCQSIEEGQKQAAESARDSVCACFARRGLDATCSKLDTVPVKFAGFENDNGVTCESGGYNRETGIIVSVYKGIVGRAVWRERMELERTLRHEYTHVLLDVSGLPPVFEDPMNPTYRDPLMKDCEQ